jgi:hypothetical protein
MEARTMKFRVPVLRSRGGGACLIRSLCSPPLCAHASRPAARPTVIAASRVTWTPVVTRGCMSPALARSPVPAPARDQITRPGSGCFEAHRPECSRLTGSALRINTGDARTNTQLRKAGLRQVQARIGRPNPPPWAAQVTWSRPARQSRRGRFRIRPPCRGGRRSQRNIHHTWRGMTWKIVGLGPIRRPRTGGSRGFWPKPGAGRTFGLKAATRLFIMLKAD